MTSKRSTTRNRRFPSVSISGRLRSCRRALSTAPRVKYDLRRLSSGGALCTPFALGGGLVHGVFTVKITLQRVWRDRNVFPNPLRDRLERVSLFHRRANVGL